jgi:hypothetical protein
MLCNEGWFSPSNVDQLITMVGKTHVARGQRGPFKDSCEECWLLENTGEHSHGCVYHRSDISLWKTGNPCKSTIMEVVNAQNQILLKTYIPRADLALYPDEFVDKRRKLYYSHNLRILHQQQ